MKNLIVLKIALVLSALSGVCNAWIVEDESELGVEGRRYSIVKQNPILFPGSWAVNMYRPSNGANVYMWDYDSDDWDQIFYIEDGMIKRAAVPNDFKQYCLNAYNPRKGSNVNTWECDSSDSDQFWSYRIVESGDTYVMFEANDSGYCLNAYRAHNGSNLNLYPCDSTDPDQLFMVFVDSNDPRPLNWE